MSTLRLLLTILPPLLAAGCWSVGPRGPLFGGAAPVAAAPAAGEGARPLVVGNAEVTTYEGRPLRASPVDELLKRLRDTKPGPERGAILEELVRRGEAGQAEVEAALREERALVELLAGIEGRWRSAQEAKRPIEAPWLDAKLQLALERYAAADFLGALRLADALIDLEPGWARAADVQALRRRCQDRLVESSLVVARLGVSSPVLSRDGPLELTLRFKNVSDQPIVLHQEADAAVGVLDLDYEELQPDGARTRVRTQHGVRLGAERLRLEPGQERAVPLRLPAPHRRLPRGVVGRYELGGRIRPTRMDVGDSSASTFLPLAKVRVLVLASEDVALAKDPAAALRDAVTRGNRGTLAERRPPAREAFVAGVLLAERDREAAFAALIEALSVSSPPLSEALCAALSRANGDPFGYTREEWLAWWTQRSARPQRSERED
ncbi:MAG: hypothetical protein AB7T09_15990 [Planctomycetota bacterium]